MSSGDAACQDALDCAAVEPFEDLRAHPKSFQPPEGKRHCRAICMTLRVSVGHVKSLVMWTPRNLKLSTHYTSAQLDVDGDMLSPLSPKVHNQLLGLTDVGEQGVQEGTKHRPLIGLRVEGQLGGGVVPY